MYTAADSAGTECVDHTHRHSVSAAGGADDADAENRIHRSGSAWVFIKRVEVGERAEKYSRTVPQEVRIYYRDIGLVDELPQSMAETAAEDIPDEVA